MFKAVYADFAQKCNKTALKIGATAVVVLRFLGLDQRFRRRIVFLEKCLSFADDGCGWLLVIRAKLPAGKRSGCVRCEQLRKTVDRGMAAAAAFDSGTVRGKPVCSVIVAFVHPGMFGGALHRAFGALRCGQCGQAGDGLHRRNQRKRDRSPQHRAHANQRRGKGKRFGDRLRAFSDGAFDSNRGQANHIAEESRPWALWRRSCPGSRCER